jgi:hypothetical protein
MGGVVGHEIGPVADELHIEKEQVHREGDDRDEDELRRAEDRARRRRGVVGQHHGEHREGDQHHEEGIRRDRPEALGEMAQAAYHEAQAEHAVQRDHERGEDGIAGDRVAAATQHHGDDHAGLEGRHGQGEDQRAEGLAKAQRDGLGMMDRGEDGAQQPHRDQDRRRAVAPGQQPDPHQREDPAPDRKDFRRATRHRMPLQQRPLCTKRDGMGTGPPPDSRSRRPRRIGAASMHEAGTPLRRNNPMTTRGCVKVESEKRQRFVRANRGIILIPRDSPPPILALIHEAFFARPIYMPRITRPAALSSSPPEKPR